MIEQQLKMPEGATIFDWSQFVLVLERASRDGQGPVIAVISCPIAAHVLAALRHYESKAEHDALAEKSEEAERGRDKLLMKYTDITLDRECLAETIRKLKAEKAENDEISDARIEVAEKSRDDYKVKLEAAERDCDEWDRRYAKLKEKNQQAIGRADAYFDAGCKSRQMADKLAERVDELEAVGLEMLRALEIDGRHKKSYMDGWLTDFGWDENEETAHLFVSRLKREAIAKAKDVFKPAELTLTERLRERLAEGASTMLKPDEIRELLDAIDGKANSPVKP